MNGWIQGLIIFIAALFFLFGVILLLAAWVRHERVKKQRDRLKTWEAELNEWATAQRENIQTIQKKNVVLKQELQTVQEESRSRALALQHTSEEMAQLQEALEQVVRERDKIKSDFKSFVDFLSEAGVLRKPTDALEVSSEQIQEFYVQSPPTPHRLPAVPGLSPEIVRAGLQHAARRYFSDETKAQPFTKAYMVMHGPLLAEHLDPLRHALVEQGYLTTTGTDKITFYRLTDAGRALLRWIHEGVRDE